VWQLPRLVTRAGLQSTGPHKGIPRRRAGLIVTIGAGGQPPIERPQGIRKQASGPLGPFLLERPLEAQTAIVMSNITP